MTSILLTYMQGNMASEIYKGFQIEFYKFVDYEFNQHYINVIATKKTASEEITITERFFKTKKDALDYVKRLINAIHYRPWKQYELNRKNVK